jgi:hypothetical protein
MNLTRIVGGGLDILDGFFTNHRFINPRRKRWRRHGSKTAFNTLANDPAISSVACDPIHRASQSSGYGRPAAYARGRQ